MKLHSTVGNGSGLRGVTLEEALETAGAVRVDRVWRRKAIHEGGKAEPRGRGLAAWEGRPPSERRQRAQEMEGVL